MRKCRKIIFLDIGGVLNSWADINFEKMFEGAFIKQYYENE